MKRSSKLVEEQKPGEPLPPPAENSDIRPWFHIGEAADLALSGIEHEMKKAHAELGAVALKARDKVRAAHDAMGEVLNVIKLWDAPPRPDRTDPTE